MTRVEDRPLRYYWHIIKSRKMVLISVLFTTIFATIIGTFLMTPSYRANATILLDYITPNPLDDQRVPVSSTLSMEYMLTEKSIIESKSVAMLVIEKLKLTEKPSMQRKYNETKLSTFQRASFWWRKEKDMRTWLLDYLRRNLTVVPQPDSRILTFSYRSYDPNFSATVVNAFVEAYNNFHLELKISPLKDSTFWISKKVEELRRKVESKEKGLEIYKTEKNVVSPQNRYNIATQKLNQLNANLVSAETRFYDASIKMEQINKIKAKVINYENLSDVIFNNFIQSLKIEKIKIEKELSESSSRLGTNHPHYLRIKAELQILEEKYDMEIHKIVHAIKNDYDFAKKRKDNLMAVLKKQKEKVLAINKETSGINTLALEAETARKIYDVVLTKFSETSLRGDVNHTNVIVIDRATPPNEPDSPKIFVNMALSVLVGLFLGIGITFLMEYMDNTIKSAEEIETNLGLVVLGVIPMFEVS